MDAVYIEIFETTADLANETSEWLTGTEKKL